MYEIVYTKQALKDLEKLKKSKGLWDRYQEKENKIAENPKNPNVPKGDFSELTGKRGIYHVRINQKHRIFYSLIESDMSVCIESIEETPDGKVKILQAFGHDLK